MNFDEEERKKIKAPLWPRICKQSTFIQQLACADGPDGSDQTLSVQRSSIICTVAIGSDQTLSVKRSSIICTVAIKNFLRMQNMWLFQ